MMAPNIYVNNNKAIANTHITIVINPLKKTSAVSTYSSPLVTHLPNPYIIARGIATANNPIIKFNTITLFLFKFDTLQDTLFVLVEYHHP